MLPTTPTARATTKTFRYSLDQARVVAVATAAITIVLVIATPPPVFFLPRASCISSVLGRWSHPIFLQPRCFSYRHGRLSCRRRLRAVGHRPRYCLRYEAFQDERIEYALVSTNVHRLAFGEVYGDLSRAKRAAHGSWNCIRQLECGGSELGRVDLLHALSTSETNAVCGQIEWGT